MNIVRSQTNEYELYINCLKFKDNYLPKVFLSVFHDFLYSAEGNKVSEINERYQTEYTYDSLARLKIVTDTTGYTFSDSYDLAGNKISQTNAKNSTITYSYDKRNRLKTTTDPFGVVISNREYDANGSNTTYTYDLAGNKIYMTDGRGKTTSYIYGSLNKLRSVKDADEGVTTYQYDLEGNVVNLCDKNGNHTTYVYDSRNLLLEKKVVETGDLITYRYDEAGNRIGMSDVSGDTTYTYDANNRLEDITKDGETQISYTYYTIGNIIKVIDLAGNTTAYTYDKASRMKTVTFDGDKITYQYDKNGNRSSLTYKSGVKEVYEYNKDDELISLVNQKPNGGELSRYSYTYDGAGRQVTKTDSYGTTKYTYDKVGRILKVDAPGKVDIYAYDGAGNRIAVSETYRSLQPSGFVDDATGNDVQYILKKTDYTYSNAGKLLKLVERMYDDSNKEVLRKSVNYYYDSNGNELSNTASWTHPHDIKLRQSTKGLVNADNMANGNSNGNSNTNSNTTDPLIDRQNNTFDGFGRLVKVERISAGVRSVSEFVYNGDNLRVSKTVKKSTNKYQEEVTNYLYDRQYVILETDKNNAVKTRYVKGINYVASINAKNVTSYFLFNGQGDVVQTVDTKGNVQNNYEYDIWGNPTLTVETVECAIRYAGEFYDSETGLYYLRARYYNPYIGRFISEDSYWGEDTNPLSLNRYTYAHNDSVQYLDPTGYAVTKKGSEGNQVKKIQNMLKDLGYNTGKVDGIFGKKTEAAVKQFQKDHKLKVDGKVGDNTNAKFKTIMDIKKESTPVGASAKKHSSSGKTSNANGKTGGSSSKTNSSPSVTQNGKKDSGDDITVELFSLTTVVDDGARGNKGRTSSSQGGKTGSITGPKVKEENTKSAGVKENPTSTRPNGTVKKDGNGIVNVDGEKMFVQWNSYYGQQYGVLPPSEVANALYEAPASILDDKDWQSHYTLMTKQQWVDSMQPPADDPNLLAYEKDLINLKKSGNPLYLVSYVWDRWIGLYGDITEQNALNFGIDPEWAELAGDFSSGMLLEGFAVTTIKGVRAIKNLKTGEIIYGDTVVGSGIGNATKTGSGGNAAASNAAKGASKSGTLEIIDPGNLPYSQSEINASQYMSDLGNDVVLRPPTGTRAGGATSDLLVNGINYDVYTPTTSNASRIISAIAKKNTQTAGIVLDLSQTSVTLEELGDILARVNGTGATNIKDIVVIR